VNTSNYRPVAVATEAKKKHMHGEKKQNTAKVKKIKKQKHN